MDKVDLLQFQVLNNGDIVYERDIGPPPPLFEDPALIKVNICFIQSCAVHLCDIDLENESVTCVLFARINMIVNHPCTPHWSQLQPVQCPATPVSS